VMTKEQLGWMMIHGVDLMRIEGPLVVEAVPWLIKKGGGR
jgi:hypothetical protein